MTFRASIDAILSDLVCGFLILAACEAAYDGNWLFGRDWQPETIGLYGTMAWCVGYFVSRISRVLLEHKLVRGCLKAPEENLFAIPRHGDRSWKQTLFHSYYSPLPESTRDRILRTAEREGFNELGSALLLHASKVVHQGPAMLRRLELYRQLSGICRNLCLGFVAISVILVSGMIWHGVFSSWGQSDLRKLGYCLLSLFEALGMLYRYLKFYRQYAMGILIGYADLQEPRGYPDGMAAADPVTAEPRRFSIHLPRPLWIGLAKVAMIFVAAGQPCREGVSAAPLENPGAADFFVSPRGRDTWSGRLADAGKNDGPFATVACARDAVRALLKTQKEPRRVRVVLRGGTYNLDAPLEFGPDDSGTEKGPVIYAAAAGERVVLSGGRRLEGGRWGEVNGRQAWMIDIPEVKEGRWRFRQLFVNGARRPRTRLPKQGEYQIQSLPGYTGDFLRSPTKEFVYAAGDIVPTWRNLRDVEVMGITKWLDNRLPIESVSAGTHTVTFDRPSLFALLSGDKPGPYWVENVFEALNTAGQWYLDRPRGVLFYLPRPDEELPSAEIIVPRLPQVVRVVGRAGAPVHDLHFEGLIFAHTEWQPPAGYASSLQAGIEVPGALLFDYAERCSVTGGGIEHIGNYGIEVNVGCADIEILRNSITDIGAGGIRIGHFFSWETDGSGQLTERGRQRKAAMPNGPHSRRITVADNEIADCGRLTPEAVGVFVGDNADNKVIHNHIHHLFYSAISVGSVQDFGPAQATGNIIEYNHVHDIGQGMLSDLAAIYTCSTPDTRIRFNLVHDVTRREYGGWGIYPDEGSHDLLIQKNLVFRCQDGALFAHHNRNITAENNIFAVNRAAQVDRGGIGGFELTCRRNLIFQKEGKVVGDYGSGNCGRNVCAFDDNLYWNASGNPLLFGKMSLAEWQAVGHDKKSLVADPLFVDPEKGDFRLHPGSPAAQIGFEPWDFSAVGTRFEVPAGK